MKSDRRNPLPVESPRGFVLPWEELVSFGMEWWSQGVVEEALGVDVAQALPELLRLTELQVRLPRMALERLAAIDGETVSAVLARELLDLVSLHSPWLSLEVPGFAEALNWPETPEVTPRSAGGGAAGGGTLLCCWVREGRADVGVGMMVH